MNNFLKSLVGVLAIGVLFVGALYVLSGFGEYPAHRSHREQLAERLPQDTKWSVWLRCLPTTVTPKVVSGSGER